MQASSSSQFDLNFEDASAAAVEGSSRNWIGVISVLGYCGLIVRHDSDAGPSHRILAKRAPYPPSPLAFSPRQGRLCFHPANVVARRGRVLWISCHCDIAMYTPNATASADTIASPYLEKLITT